MTSQGEGGRLVVDIAGRRNGVEYRVRQLTVTALPEQEPPGECDTPGPCRDRTSVFHEPGHPDRGDADRARGPALASAVGGFVLHGVSVLRRVQCTRNREVNSIQATYGYVGYGLQSATGLAVCEGVTFHRPEW